MGALELQLKRHWAEHLPKMYAELEANGTLDSRLKETADQMREQETTMLRQGINPDQAREMTREIGFLPGEDNDNQS